MKDSFRLLRNAQKWALFLLFVSAMVIGTADLGPVCNAKGPVSFLFGEAVAYARQQEPLPLWPHDRSELKPDPNVKFGTLANGFRYAMMTNGNPKGRVSMHLNVMAGSMHETDGQCGLSHFLEHMLFNGSVHFPPGEMVKFFQEIGMQFGPDANAHTGFSETVYDILLPDGSRDNLRKALVVMQDFAAGALLLPQEIERERRIVLAEKRSRDSAGYRTFVSSLAFEFPDARLSKRLPIGSETVIRKADRSEFMEYYNTWYRPDKMILVMVGDFDPEVAAPLVEESFRMLVPRAQARPDPDFGDIAHEGLRTFYHHEAEEGKTTVAVEVITKQAPESDSAALQKRLLIEQLANRIVQNRLDDIIRSPSAVVTDASIHSGVFLRQGKIGSIQAESKPENWQKALAVVERTLRRSLLFGFSDEEVNRVKREMQSELDDAVRQFSTRESPDVARDIIRHINMDRVFMSPGQEKELLAPILETLTPQMVHEGFKMAWNADHRLVLVTGNADLTVAGMAPEQVIHAAFEESRRIPVMPRASVKSVRFPYLPEPGGTAGKLQRRSISDLGLVQVDFENGVRLNMKTTDFKADEIVARLDFGFGKSSQPIRKAGLADLSVDAINESGIGELDGEELERALAGRSTDIVFGIEENSFFLKGKTVRSEIQLLFQLFYAFLKDPGFRDDAYTLVKERKRQQYLELARTVNGAVVLTGRRFLSGGDNRFGLPPWEAFEKLTLEDVRSWVKPLLDSAEFEVSLVGDFDVDDVIALAAKYLGTLPRRKAPAPPDAQRRPVFPRNRSLTLRIDTKIPKGLVVVAYPTKDLHDIHLARRLHVLAEVFSEILREKIREKLGASYSPVAFNRPSRAYPGYGTFQAFVQTDPAEASAVRSEVRSIADDLARDGVTPEELRRALEPTLTGIRDMLRTNGYWLNTVLSGSRRNPDQLDWARTIATDYAAITAEELSAAAGSYLDNGQMASLIVLPGEKGVH